MAAHAPAEDLSVGFAPLPPRKILCFAKKSFSLSYQSHHLISILPVPVALPYEPTSTGMVSHVSRHFSAEIARETPSSDLSLGRGCPRDTCSAEYPR